ANKQNAELQKKIDEMNKGSEAGRKANEEQMTKLNARLAELQKVNKEQAEAFDGQLRKMQEGNGLLQKSVETMTAKNGEYIDRFNKSEARCARLEEELKYARNKKGNYGLLIGLVVAVIILITVLILELKSH
ncbi:MAG: hypothetical protein KBT27_11485, partial [Prevotellaceae bacterium]|nr:hypothetical protein [Candidatus Faecinaster equi]